MRNETASPQNVIHDHHREIIRIIPHDPGQHYGHAALVDVFIHHVSPRRRENRIRRNGRRTFSFEWPVGKKLFQLLDHWVTIEIAADSENEACRMKPLVVKALDIAAGDPIERSGSIIPVGPELFAKSQETYL